MGVARSNDHPAVNEASAVGTRDLHRQHHRAGHEVCPSGSPSTSSMLPDPSQIGVIRAPTICTEPPTERRCRTTSAGCASLRTDRRVCVGRWPTAAPPIDRSGAPLNSSGCSGDHTQSQRRASHNARRGSPSQVLHAWPTCAVWDTRHLYRASAPGEQRCQGEREVRGVLQGRALPLTLTLAGDGAGLAKYSG